MNCELIPVELHNCKKSAQNIPHLPSSWDNKTRHVESHKLLHIYAKYVKGRRYDLAVKKGKNEGCVLILIWQRKR